MAKQSKAALAKQASELMNTRQQCKSDLMYLSKVLGYDFQEIPHKELFDNYLHIIPDKPLFDQDSVKDRLILWSRGTYKTTSIVVEVIQLILNFPNVRVLLMQGTVKNTIGLLREIKSHFDGTNFKSSLKDIFPEFCSIGKRFGTQYTFTCPVRTQTYKEGTVTVASPKSVTAGQHFDVGVFDDLIHENNFRNPELVAKTISEFNLFIPLIDPGGFRFVTGTRYGFDELYGHLIRQNTQGGKWQISVKSCWTVDSDGNKTLLFPQVTLPDGRTIGHTVEMLEAIQISDAAMFSCQYLNSPIVAGTQLFPEELILSHVRTPQEKDFPDLGFKTLFIDLATSGVNDDSVILCGQQDGFNRMYCTDGIGGQWNVYQLACMVIDQALKHRPVRIMIEKSAAGVVFKDYVQLLAKDKGLTLPVEFLKVSNQKDAKCLRIATVAGALKQDKLYFLAGLPCWTSLLEQFVTFPRSRHDDYCDTVSLMYQYFSINGTSTPVVTSIAAYLMAQPAVPEFTIEQSQPSFGGDLGSDF